MARPRKEIDFEHLEKLCNIFCTKDEICDFFGIDEKTLTARVKEKFGVGFSDYYKKAANNGKISLRREQFKLALKGNATMLIWLGKNILKQSDKVEMLQPVQDARHAKPKMTYSEFCVNAGYPPPYPKQEEMRAFGIDGNGSRLLLGARGYGKTDYVTILGIAYAIYLDRTFTALIVTKDPDRNAAMLKEIRDALEKAGVEFEIDNARALRVKGLLGKDHSVSAATINSVRLRGRHPRIIVMDDPVTPEDTSEATRRKAKAVYNECVKLKANVLLIGQPVHVFDLYQELRTIVPCMEAPYGTIPELDADLEAQRAAGVDNDTIEASYFLRVKLEGKIPFAKINYLEGWLSGKTSVAFIDPAFGGADTTAIAIITSYLEGFAIVGFAWNRSWEHCLEPMAEAIKKYNVKKIAFETNKTGDQPLDILRKAFGVGVSGIFSNSNKHSRIMAAGAFSHLMHLSRDSNKAFIDQTIRYEYNAKNDDAPDAIASCLAWLGLIKGKQ